jgi:hypothetical protein
VSARKPDSAAPSWFGALMNIMLIALTPTGSSGVELRRAAHHDAHLVRDADGMCAPPTAETSVTARTASWRRRRAVISNAAGVADRRHHDQHERRRGRAVSSDDERAVIRGPCGMSFA